MFNTSDFILWKKLQDGRKMPVCPLTGAAEGYQERTNGVSYKDAHLLAGHAAGHRVGFVFYEAAPYWFLDIDHCIDADGVYSAVACELLETLKGCAVERSQGGDGLHIFGSYAGTVPPHACKNTLLGIELYHRERFVALTEDWLTDPAGVEVTPAAGVLEGVISKYFPPSAALDASVWWSMEARDDYDGPEDDLALLRAARAAKSAASVFGGSSTFGDLYDCNTEALAVAYPTQNDRDDFDRSSADGALAMHLLWWTGQNHERALDLMRQSELTRDKWEREDYLPRTISSASGQLGDRYYSKGKATAERADVATAERIAKPHDERALVPTQYVAPNILDVPGQMTLFGGLVAIASRNTVYDPSKGLHMTKDTFNMRYGNTQYVIDTNGKVTPDAWTAFFKNPLVKFPQADHEGFDPNLEPAGIYTDDRGATYFNTYRPVTGAASGGDVSLFMAFLVKLLPAEHDREILLAWMSYVLKNPGKKALWCPVLQGVPGNGKTTIARVMRHAIGSTYSRVISDATLGETHNAWMMGALFVQMDEILITGKSKDQKIKRLNAYITDETFGLRRMNRDVVDCPNFSNFMFTTNYRDAVPKYGGERRFAVLYTNQQDDGDRERDGLTPKYFSDVFYPWLNGGGYEAVAYYLRHEHPEHPEFYGAANVPETTSHSAAVQESLGEIAEAIKYNIEIESTTGVNGTFISLNAVRDRLQIDRVRHNDKTLAWALRELGYHRHRGVDRGRINVIPDDHGWDIPAQGKLGKVVLYVANGSTAAKVAGEPETRKAYLFSCDGEPVAADVELPF